MRSRDKTWLLFALSVAIAIGSVHAQTPSPEPAAPTTDEAQPAAGVRLSVQEMRDRSAALQVTAQQDYRHLVYLQTQARKQKDIIKLNCINDKLVQFKAQMNILDGMQLRLTAALERDGEERHTVFAEIQASGKTLNKIKGEADLCAGAELIGPESVTAVDRPEFPDDPTTWDPTWDPTVATPDLEPPGYASPFN